MLKSEKIKQVIKDQNINVFKMCMDLEMSQSGFYYNLRKKDIQLSALLKLIKYLKIDLYDVIEGFEAPSHVSESIPEYGKEKIQLLEKLVKNLEENNELLKYKLEKTKNLQ